MSCQTRIGHNKDTPQLGHAKYVLSVPPCLYCVELYLFPCNVAYSHNWKSHHISQSLLWFIKTSEETYPYCLTFTIMFRFPGNIVLIYYEIQISTHKKMRLSLLNWNNGQCNKFCRIGIWETLQLRQIEDDWDIH